MTGKVVKTIEELRQWRALVEPGSTVGVVPTMGALHRGHEALLEKMKKDCDQRVLTLFLNPLQFGPNEDLERYPRTFEQDLKIASKQGVDLVFAPAVSELYPPDFSFLVHEKNWSHLLCGATRSGHFDGVCTVVLKLFHLVQPHQAFFGLKDLQQYLMIRKMIRDLNLPIELKGVSTVRDSDGLALSSRNRFLSQQEREKAPLLYRSLKELRENPTSEAIKSVEKKLESEGFRVEYLEHRDFQTLKKIESPCPDRKSFIALAAHLGSTRLIDNIIIDPMNTQRS